jgi:hypothetical protein
MNRQPTLSNYVERYNRLRDFWNKARAAIIEAAKTRNGAELYQVVPKIWQMKSDCASVAPLSTYASSTT